MNKSIILSVLGLLVCFRLGAQTEVYTGKNGDQLFQLVYSPAQNIAAFSWNSSAGPGSAQLVPVGGENGSVVFTDANGLQLLNGHFSGNLFTGSLTTGTDRLELKLIKRNAETLSGWEFLHAEGSFRHKNDRGTGAMIELNYFFPEKPENPLVPVLASFYGLNARLGKPDQMMQSDVESFVERYRQMSTTAEGNTLEMNWMKSATGYPVFAGGGLLCISKNSVVSTGTQSVRRHAEYGVFDLSSGKALSFDDIFVPESRAELAALLTSALLKLSRLEPGSNLREAGYFAENVNPNENIVLGAGAIGFAYNVFELGPPAKGQPVLLLPLKSVEHLLRPEIRSRLNEAFRTF